MSYILFFTTREWSFFNSAAVFSFWQEITYYVSRRILRLWERINSLIVLGVIFLTLRSDVLYTSCPSVQRCSPRTRRFNGDVVYTSANSEIATLSPMWAPRVSHGPILFSFFADTPTNNWYNMVSAKITSIITVDTTSVQLERIGNRNVASNRSSLIDLLNHIIFPRNQTIFIGLIYIVLIRYYACLARGTVSAFSHRWANTTVIKTTCCVNWASFISHLISCHPLKSEDSVSTVTP